MIRSLRYALLALLLTSSVASARTLIITAKPTSAEISIEELGFENSRAQLSRNLSLWKRLIESTGGSVDFAYAGDMTTWWARNGCVWRGTPRPFTDTPTIGYKEQYDAVVYMGPQGALVTGACRPDSMSRYTKYPKVPFAWVAVNTQMANAFDVYSDLPPHPVDTCGANTWPLDGYAGMKIPGAPISWSTMAYLRPMKIATAPNSRTIITPVLLSRAPALTSAALTGVNCMDCSATHGDGNLDTAYVIKKLWTDIPDAKPFVIGIFNQYSPYDSTQIIKQLAEGELTVALSILAVLDSASGGRVFGNKPVVLAPVMDKGLHRGSRRGANGIFPPDTAGHYAIMDSVRVHNFPITVAFDTDLDTLAAYSRDLIVYSRVPSLHFTPQCWTGVMDTTVNAYQGKGAQASKYRVVDPFGRWRNRAAMGAASSSVADTGMYSLLYSMRVRGDSILTEYGISASRISRILVAPDDDWSPLLLRRSPAMSPPSDSVLYALKQAGFNGIVVDVQDAEADANRAGAFANTNPRGWIGKERSYRSSLLSDFRLLGHSGYPVMGGRAQTSTFSDSIAPFDSLNLSIVGQETSRVWAAAFNYEDRDYDTFPSNNYVGSVNLWPYWDNVHFRKADIVYAVRGPAHIIRLSASDFSGAPGAPAANGYHTLKNIDMACQGINRIAGRTIVKLGYPEDILP